jgi:hypothetical protein
MSVVHEADPASAGGPLVCLRCGKSSDAPLSDQWSYLPEYVTCPGNVPAPPEGVWLAYNQSGSAVVPFATEIEALRYALGLTYAVKFAEFGDDDWRRK